MLQREDGSMAHGFCISIFFMVTVANAAGCMSQHSSTELAGPHKINFQFTQAIPDTSFVGAYLINDQSIGQAIIKDKGTPDSKTAILSEIFIDSKYQRKGHGTDFLRFILETLKELKYQRVELEIKPQHRGSSPAPSPKELRLFFGKFAFDQSVSNYEWYSCDLTTVSLPTISYASTNKTYMGTQFIINKIYHQ